MITSLTLNSPADIPQDAASIRADKIRMRAWCLHQRRGVDHERLDVLRQLREMRLANVVTLRRTK